MSELIEEQPSGFFGRIRKRVREKKQIRKAEKARIKGIAAEERANLERRFIRRQERRKLQKKFDKPSFKLAEARRKAKIAKFNRSMQPTGKPVGDKLLGSIGGFGIGPPRKKKKETAFQLY